MAHLLGIREVIVDLLVHDVENHIQKIPARQGRLRNFTYKIFLPKKSLKSLLKNVPHEEEEAGEDSRVLVEEPERRDLRVPVKSTESGRKGQKEKKH